MGPCLTKISEKDIHHQNNPKNTVSTLPKSKPPSPTQNNDRKYLDLCQHFPIVDAIKKRMQKTSYTSDDLEEVIQSLEDCFVNVCRQPETSQQKTTVNTLIDRYRQQIANNSKSYYDIVKQYKSTSSNINDAVYSRIFHALASIPKNSINCLRPTDGDLYDIRLLNSDQINEIVAVEILENKVEWLGNKFYFKYLSLTKQTQELKNLLRCIIKNSGILQSLKYDLSEAESLQIAEISREACQHHQKGIFILLVYFVKCCQKLQSQQISVKQIEKFLIKCLELIASKYPPGQKHQGSHQSLEALRRIEKEKDDIDKKPVKLSKEEKKSQLDTIIRDNAILAQSYKGQFENLVSQTCLSRCIAFKTGLKLNPSLESVSQKKALVRIQQKMLLKGKSDFKRSEEKTIEKILEDQQNLYNEIVEQELVQMKEIVFKISDMVRGKCTFATLEDIILTVQDIIDFVRQSESGVYRVTEIQNRFKEGSKGEPPISDVTIKIAHHQQIVSELQLTLQTNKAAYEFAHKIYEFNRCKVFSKIKVVHNYFQEYQKHIRELLKRTISLDEQISKSSRVIQQFFDLEKPLIFDFNQVLLEKFSQSTITNSPEPIKTNKNLIDLIFLRKMKEPLKQLSQNVLKSLEDHKKRSICYRGAILYQFFKDLEMEELLSKIRYDGFCQYMLEEHRFRLWTRLSNEVLSSSRIGLKFLELDLLKDVSKGSGSPNAYGIHLINIFGKNSVEYCSLCVKMAKMKQFNEKYKQSINLLQEAHIVLHSVKGISTTKQISSSSIKLQIAENHLSLLEPENAKQIIDEIWTTIKKKQPGPEMLLCEIFQAECLLLQKKTKEFQKAYHHAQEAAKINGLTLKGNSIAKSQWRIGSYLLQGAQQNEALDIHIRNSLEEFSHYLTGENLIRKMQIVWSRYSKIGLKYPSMGPNSTVVEINLIRKQLSDQDCQLIVVPNWPNLGKLQLDGNRISDVGCAVLRKGKWPSLFSLSLYDNEVGTQGWRQLLKAEWPQLFEIHLGSNLIDYREKDELKQKFFQKFYRIQIVHC